MPISRVYLPWANLKADAAAEITPRARAKELEGGSWVRGRKLFHGEEAKCSKCHAISAGQSAIGPDLSNLIHRDYVSVLRDVTLPSFAINPDFAASVFTLKDGRALTGSVRTMEGKLHVGDKDGKVIIIDPSEVESREASKTSVMPDGLLKELGAEKTRDLLTYLLTPPPTMPRDLVEGRPAPRQKSEVLALLAGCACPGGDDSADQDCAGFWT